MNDEKTDHNEGHNTLEKKLKNIAKLLIMLAGALFGGLYILGACVSMYFDSNLYRVAIEQVPAVIGLPSAALASLWVVVFLENTSGPIEFEMLGFKFKGAAGPIVLWVLGMLAISGAIKFLWIT